MKVVGRVFGFLFQAFMFLVSLGILAGFGLVLLGGLDDPFLEMRRGYWTLVTAAGVILALVVNPVIWRLLKGRVPTLLFLALGLGLPVGLFTLAAWTPYGLYLRSGLDWDGEETDLAVDAKAGSSEVATISATLRLAAERGDPEAQLELAQQLVKTEGASADEGLAILRDAASVGSANAQALLTLLQMGRSFEGRVVTQRNDPEACKSMLALASPPFAEQAIDPEWRRAIEEESRLRGWRRADEPGEPLNCDRASLNPKIGIEIVTFVEGERSTIPARFDALADLKVTVACTVANDFRLENCTVLTALPAGRGVDRWALEDASRVRLAPKDIYGYPVAGRKISYTVTSEDETD